MAQQLAIIVLVDVANAIASSSLDDNVYLFDNMKLQGSTGEGTGGLVTAVAGTYWSDGSQGTEQVLNWLPYSLGSIPPTVPRSYDSDRARRTDRRALDELAGADADLAGVRQAVGTRAAGGARHLAGRKLLDVTGNVISGDDLAAVSHPNPIITDITGQAVDEKIIYPAQYASPDMVSDGWYWSASVDTARPGSYGYTMHIQLHGLVAHEGGPRWEAVDLTCESSLVLTAEPKRNGFTGGGLGVLPVPCPAVSEEY